MKDVIKDINWRSHLIGLVAFSGCTAFLIVSIIFRVEAQLALKNANTLFQQQRSLNDNAEMERQILIENSPQYQNLRTQGIIGEANRLNWVEVLDQVSHDLKIPKIRFTLEKAMTPSDLDTPYWDSEIQLEFTEMKLHMQVLHEGDVQKFLHIYAKKTNGLFGVEKCAVNRSDEKGGDSFVAGFVALCDLRFYVIKDINTPNQDISAL